MNKQKKSHGWVIQKIKGNGNIGRFVKASNMTCYTPKLSCADVFPSRRIAREEKLDFEIIHKVHLTKTGKPEAIIVRR